MTRLLAIILLISSTLSAAVFDYVAPEAEYSVEALYAYPQTRQFLNSLEGPISIKWVSMGKHGHMALWHGGPKEIWLNASKIHTEGEKITYILMELHNAASNNELCHVDRLAWQKLISKRDYIERIERIEHVNALRTKKLLSQGVVLGYFPQDACYLIYPNFEDHLRLQMSCGHSHFLAKRFEELTGKY